MKFVNFLTLSLISAIAPLSQATTIVNWGDGATDIVTANQTVTGAGSSSLNLGALANPTQGADYYPNYVVEGASPFFYAASTGTTLQVQSNAIDQLYARLTASDQGVIYLWTKEYFLNGGDTGAVELNSAVINTNSNSGVDQDARLVIQLGSNYYISEGLGEGTVNILDPSSLSWFNYDVSTFQTIGSAASVSGFNNLNAVGFYYTGTGNAHYYSNGFQVDGTVSIPEPSTISLISVVALVVYLRRRNK